MKYPVRLSIPIEGLTTRSATPAQVHESLTKNSAPHAHSSAPFLRILRRNPMPQNRVISCLPCHALLSALWHYALVGMLFCNTVALQSKQEQRTQPTARAYPHQNNAASNSAYNFARISIERGLSQSSVYTMVQDKQGFMWFGTQDGLNKFDGYSFTSIRANKLLTTHTRTVFPNGWLTSLICDKHGNLWTGMNGGGLVFTHRETGALLVMNDDTLASTPENAIASKELWANARISSTFINAIQCDVRGTIWIATDKGIDYIPNPQAQYSLAKPPAVKHLQHPSLKNGVNALAVDSAGNLWLATSHALLRYSTLRQTFDSINLPDQFRAAQPSVFSLFIDRLGRVWAGSAGNGIFLYNPLTHFQRVIAHDARTPAALETSLANNRVFALQTDARGYLWVGTDGGVSILEQDIFTLPDDAPVRFTNCRYSPVRVRSVSDNAVRSLYSDRSGTMWVGTLVAGLSSWHPIRQRFGLYSPELGNADFLPSRIVRSFHEINDTLIWIGTDGGAVRWNRRTGAAFTLHPDTHPVMTSPRVWSVVPDPQKPDILWLGTDGGGFYRYDTRSQALRRFDNSANTPNSLVNNRVRFMRFDKNGSLWLCTLSGLDCFDPKTEIFTHYAHNPDDSTSLANNRIHAVFEDSRGRLWVATAQGLNLFQAATRSWRRFTHTTDSTSLPSDWIRSVMQTRDGTIWVSTIRGISSYDEQRNCFRTFDQKHGLANEYVYGILEDKQGFLWMGTDNGLARFDRKTASFRIFEQADGLQSNEFNTNAFFCNPHGDLFFGGVNGFNIIEPEKSETYRYMPTVLLTSVKVMNEQYRAKRDVSLSPEIIVSHRENIIELGFSAFDFSNIERVQYSYRLEGSMDAWSQPSLRNFISFTNLPPGAYLLHVRASNSDNVWSENEVQVQLTITPPFWATWWFRGLAAFCMAGFVWTGYRWRVSSIARRNMMLAEEVQYRTAELRERSFQLEQSNQELSWANDRLHELNNEKNALLGIAAHDMKTPLGTILTITELLEDTNHPPNTEETRAFSSMIRQTAERMLGLVRQVLDMNMIEEGRLQLSLQDFDLRDTLNKVIFDARALAYPKNITLHFTPPPEALCVHADHIATIQCLENILSNAVKYSPLGKNVWMEVEEKQEGDKTVVCVSVRDEGQGLTEKDKERLFMKFARLSARPTGGEHSSGLGLSIVKKLLEAMHGDIRCISQHGKGATFVIVLPRAKVQ